MGQSLLSALPGHTRQQLDISRRMVAKSKSVFEITPHKRRGPIAAEFSTPGPASIALPGLIGNVNPESNKLSSPSFSLRMKPAGPKQFLTPAPGAYKNENSERYLEEKIQYSMGIKTTPPKQYKTPAPGAYKSEDSERYLEEKIQHSMGMKLQGPKKFLTPAPGAYKSEDSERYLDEKIQHSMGIKLEGPKKFLTPAPNHYEAIIPNEDVSFSFGVRHSPYLYDGNKNGNSFFRSRSGTYTKA